MTQHPHLPCAVDFPDAASLLDVRDGDLTKMLDECRRWSQHIEIFRASLVTPVAQTLWKVMLCEEVLLVAASIFRIENEIAERLRNAAADAVPALGETLPALKEPLVSLATDKTTEAG
ncbi:hypothetical protein [Aureimonas glaciei]|uniref:Uncharacterized protein n=1 Tax=Aureimonas glaciei TaxID=1776957 RepID=A0A917DCM7_9HYPH|nr:hypothetical protein [Aureimonas glaciei]GGD29138.1 hypothetical protein GCM10011335_35350 [Aureimonas glaciei]